MKFILRDAPRTVDDPTGSSTDKHFLWCLKAYVTGSQRGGVVDVCPGNNGLTYKAHYYIIDFR